MNRTETSLTEELIQRCALKRNASIGPLSDAAYRELLLAVHSDPKTYAEETGELSFYYLAQAVQLYVDAQNNDEAYNDEEFMATRTERIKKLWDSLASIREKYGETTDLLRIKALLDGSDHEHTLQTLLHLQQGAREEIRATDLLSRPDTSDMWGNVFARPYLRLHAAIAREYLDTARFRLSQATCEQLLKDSPSDQVGARLTLALVYARLEDENALNRLDKTYNPHSNAWSELARAILLFKLSRLSSARRALKSYQMNTEGGAFALLHPTFVDVYIPDRPKAAAGSFEEALLAIHEAEPIIVDSPDFVGWAEQIPDFSTASDSYAEANGFDLNE